MFSTGVQKKLQARHYLRGNFGEESSPHSHPYLVEAVCRSPELDGNGFSTDIAVLEDQLGAILDEIDDVLLNELAFFQDRQPSLENLCVYLWDRLVEGLRGRNTPVPAELEIRIWESGTSWASYDHRV